MVVVADRALLIATHNKMVVQVVVDQVQVVDHLAVVQLLDLVVMMVEGV